MKSINSKLILLGTVCLISACGVTEQATKVQDTVQSLGGAQELVGMGKGVTQTLDAVKSGNFDQAKQEFSSVQQNWTDVEGKLKASPETITNIKDNVANIATDLKASPPDKDKILGNLQTLSGSVGTLAKGEAEASVGGAAQPQTEAEKAQAFTDNLVAMREALSETNTALESSDFAGAKESFGNARQTWFKFGGSVKEKSSDTYQVMDQGVKTVNTALNQSNPTQETLLTEVKNLSSELETVTN